jgi:hypothetical protein
VAPVTPRRKADTPTTAVVATPPQAPISQTPIFRFAIMNRLCPVRTLNPP